MKENIIQKKSEDFALRIVKLYIYSDCDEIIRILTSIVKTQKKKLEKLLTVNC